MATSSVLHKDSKGIKDMQSGIGRIATIWDKIGRTSRSFRGAKKTSLGVSHTRRAEAAFTDTDTHYINHSPNQTNHGIFTKKNRSKVVSAGPRGPTTTQARWIASCLQCEAVYDYREGIHVEGGYGDGSHGRRQQRTTLSP